MIQVSLTRRDTRIIRMLAEYARSAALGVSAILCCSPLRGAFIARAGCPAANRSRLLVIGPRRRTSGRKVSRRAVLFAVVLTAGHHALGPPAYAGVVWSYIRDPHARLAVRAKPLKPGDESIDATIYGQQSEAGSEVGGESVYVTTRAPDERCPRHPRAYGDNVEGKRKHLYEPKFEESFSLRPLPWRIMAGKTRACAWLVRDIDQTTTARFTHRHAVIARSQALVTPPPRSSSEQRETTEHVVANVVASVVKVVAALLFLLGVLGSLGYLVVRLLRR